MVAHGHALRLKLLTSSHLVLHLQLAIGLHLLACCHLVLRLHPSGLCLLNALLLLGLRLLRPHVLLLGLRLLRPHVLLLGLGLLGAHVLLSLSLLRPGMLGLRHLRPALLLLSAGLLDPVGLHLVLVHLCGLTGVNLRLRSRGHGSAIRALRPLGRHMGMAAAIESERSLLRALEVGASASASRKARGRCPRLDLGPTASAPAANRGCASAVRSAAPVITARTGSGGGGNG